MDDRAVKKDRRFLECLHEFHRSVGEEWANSMTHLLGVVFAVVGLTMMCVFSSQRRTALYITSCAIYGTTLVILFTASMLYHYQRSFGVKRIFQILDHCSIYLLIAGSYTPYSLLGVGGVKGWTVFGVEWGLAMAGLVMESVLSRRLANMVSLPLFLVMGWMIVFVIGDAYSKLNMPAFATLCAGGLAYTVGVLFYLMDRVPYMHTVWHVFVLGGAVCHWVSITFFIV